MIYFQLREYVINEIMSNQKEIFLNKLADYQGNEETNDDVTLVGFIV